MEWKDLLPWNLWGTKRVKSVETDRDRALALQRGMDAVFDDFRRWRFDSGFLPSSMGESWSAFLPKVDLEETKRKVEVTIEVPGLSEKDLELTLSTAGDVLFVRGERKHESETKDEEKNWHRSERYHGVIQRSIQLPCAVSMEGSEAKLSKGVLRAILPKQEDSSEAKRISVTRG